MPPRLAQEKILLVADPQRDLHAALIAAMPSAAVTAVNDYFDAVAELCANSYSSVFAAAEPIERRPEAAVKTLRELAGNGRVILFGQPSLEGLSRKMLEFGADDYIITPVNPAELGQIFGTPVLRVAAPTKPLEIPGGEGEVKITAPPSSLDVLHSLPLAEIVLDAMVLHPADAPQAAVKRIAELIAPTMQLSYQAPGKPAPSLDDGYVMVSNAVRMGQEESAHVHLILAQQDQDAQAARHFLAQIAHLLSKVATLQDRHNRLQKLAITDQLTGVYNRRYFEHFLARILEKAKTLRFPVTLVLFDIDDFKKYNDTFGHGVGDQILKETAAIMRRCCREHDLVARIGGDEFAVVFWEKEGPRLPKDGKPAPTGKPPQTPRQVMQRFRRIMRSQEFQGLGRSGKGTLTISGALASYPWDGRDVAELIENADKALVEEAKRGGKDRIYLVGEGEEMEDGAE